MKHLHGEARAAVRVPVGDCFAFLAALDAYPSWHADVVRDVQVVEADGDGIPLKAETKLHLAWGPVSRDIDLLLGVDVEEPSLVQLRHIPRGRSSGASFDATWRLEDGAETRLALELDATMPVPRLVPLTGVGNAFADGFMKAAVAGLGASS